jgi:hypothetical membrane protein
MESSTTAARARALWDLRRFGLRCGVAAPIVWLAIIALAGVVRPDFNLMVDYISELGEQGSSTALVVNYAGFVLTGALYVCFAATVGVAFQGRSGYALAAALIALDGIGRMGAGVYVCDLGCNGSSRSQELHRLFATVGFSSGILAALGWGVIALRQARLRGLAGYSMATGLAAAILLLLMSSEPTPFSGAGLFEHLASALLSVWVLVFALRLLRVERSRVPDSALEVT